MNNDILVNELKIALKNSIVALRKETNEKFYYYAFIFDSGMHPYISAWSYEALEKSIVDNQINDDEKSWWKWNYSDSPYAVYGYDEFFCEVNKMLDERTSKLSSDELYSSEWETRVNAMEESLKQLDIEGFFGSGDVRKGVVINVEVAPPDYHEYERAIRLNKKTKLLYEYLDNCES